MDSTTSREEILRQFKVFEAMMKTFQATTNVDMAPVTSVPTANVPVTSVPTASVPVKSGPATNVPVTNDPVSNVPIINVPATNVPDVPVANLLGVNEHASIVPNNVDDSLAVIARPYQALFYDKTKPLSLTEASKLFENESKAIEEMPHKPSGGEVFLFKGKTSQYENDWRTDGHRMVQINGGRWAYNGLLLRKVSSLVTPDSGPKGTNLFQRISWNHKLQPQLTLIQYVGNHSLSVDFPHGNSKQDVPYTRSAPSVIRDIEVGNNKPNKEYQTRVFNAPTDIASQKLRAPRNVTQVRNARQNFK